jgi:hypothetical protein
VLDLFVILFGAPARLDRFFSGSAVVKAGLDSFEENTTQVGFVAGNLRPRWQAAA